MGTLFECDKLRLSEENFGGLWLYLKDTTLELNQSEKEYDFAFNFDEINHKDLKSLAYGILAYVEGDTSIE
tara:strand:- start:969 stop:1181 length:213 start_codon:yes stop_codon:yes gene_type:complete